MVITFYDMFYTLKISKQIKKKIHQYHRWNIKWFVIICLIGFLFLILAIITTKVVIYFDMVNVEILYVIIGMMYLFTFIAPPSILLLVKYSTDSVLTKDLFKNKNKLTKIIDELKSNQTNEKVREFQRVTRHFNSDFYYLYWGYFKHYKKRVKTSSTPLMDYYIDIDKILNLVSLNAEIYSNKTIELLSDFSKFLDDVEKKILIPILDRNILMHDVENFIEWKTKHFKDNYTNKYRDSSRILERYIKIQGEKYRKKSQLRGSLINYITGAVVLLIIGLLVRYFSGISLF